MNEFVRSSFYLVTSLHLLSLPQYCAFLTWTVSMIRNDVDIFR